MLRVEVVVHPNEERAESADGRDIRTRRGTDRGDRIRRFAHHAVLADAAANPIGVALHVTREFGLLHFTEGLAEFRGRLAL